MDPIKSPAVDIVAELCRDPIKLGKVLWPDVRFYREQRAIIRSVWENDETVVPAGHMLGKDFVTGFICLAFFLTRNPCRVVTTSVDSKQLEQVLWGEIRRFIQTCAHPLEDTRGGPLVVNHLHLRKMIDGKVDPTSYCIGRVAAKGEGLSGHHVAKTGDGIPRTLAIADEASGVDQESFDKLPEWAHRTLIIGNPYPCSNYFKWAVMGRPDKTDLGGDIPRDGTLDGYHRKVIRIEGTDSPNVRLAIEERKAGREPSNRILLQGVLPYEDFERRIKMWDPIKQAIGLRAIFYEGAEELMFPPLWLNASEERATYLAVHKKDRTGISMGVDAGQGKANTSMTSVDSLGVLERLSLKTPDTSMIAGRVKAFATKWGIPPRMIFFDAGGGGYQIACQMRSEGWDVQTVHFGESIRLETRRGRAKLGERKQQQEEKYVYLNRRGEMYGALRAMLDPTANEHVFAIPAWFPEYRLQLSPIPLRYDGNGRMILPPKTRKPGTKGGDKSMEELIGHSPDEADSLVLAVYGLRNPARRQTIGAAW